MKNSADQGGCYTEAEDQGGQHPQNIFKLLKEKMSSLFFCSLKITQPRPPGFSVNSSIICSGCTFGVIDQYDKILSK